MPTNAYPARLAEWTTAADGKAVLDDLVKRATQLGSVRQTQPSGLVALVGSRFGYRMLGFLGKRMFPAQLTVAVSTAGDRATRVRVFGEDNAGWYLVQTKLGERHFDRQFRKACLRLGAPSDVVVQLVDHSQPHHTF
jgi:hypothetical protein